MLTFIKKILAFTSIGIVLYIVCLFVLGLFVPPSILPNIKYKPGNYGYMYTRLNEADTASRVDILVLGASHAYRGIDPREFKRAGWNVFNLASSAQTPIQTEYLLGKYIDSFKPKLIVYEIAPTVFSNEGVESTLDIMANSDLNSELFKMALKSRDLWVLNTFFYAIGKKLADGKKNIKDNAGDDEDAYISGGFVQKKSLENTSSLVFDDKQIEFLESQKDAFERILAVASRKNVQIILVQAPITSEYYRSIKNMNEINNYFLSRKANAYYNFNDFMSLDSKAFFYDHHHLNQNGVQFFNKALLDKIQPFLKKN